MKKIILENDRVQLAPLRIESFNYLFPIAKTIDMYYSPNSIQTETELKRYIKTALESKDSIAFSIFDKQTQQYAGSTRYYLFSDINKRLAIGYTWIGEIFRGTKLNQNIKYLMLSYAFETLKVERVEFYADSLNQQSIRAMKKIGCKEEGILRNHSQMRDNRRRDTIVLSILKSEWEKEIKEHVLSIL